MYHFHQYYKSTQVVDTGQRGGALQGALVYKGGVSGCRGLTALLSFKFPPFSRFLTLRQLTAQQLARQVSSVNKLAYKRCFKTQRHLSRDSKEVFHEIILIRCNNVLSHTIHELVGIPYQSWLRSRSACLLFTMIMATLDAHIPWGNLHV